MSYLASRTVKKVLREKIYTKLLRLGSAYNQKISSSEIVQVAVEGVDQLETYFGAYLPQFFFSVLAPFTLFVILSFVNMTSALVLLICVPLIPVTIAVIQTWAKKLLSKYWGQYTALGMILAILQLRAGKIDMAGCLMIILLSADYFIPMRRLGSYFHIAMNGMAASDKIFRLLDIPEEQIKEAVIREDVSISLKNVCFRVIPAVFRLAARNCPQFKKKVLWIM